MKDLHGPDPHSLGTGPVLQVSWSGIEGSHRGHGQDRHVGEGCELAFSEFQEDPLGEIV